MKLSSPILMTLMTALCESAYSANPVITTTSVRLEHSQTQLLQGTNLVYSRGQEVEHHIHMENASPKPSKYIYRWEMFLNDVPITGDEDTGTINAWDSLSIPLSFKTPTNLFTETLGKLQLIALIGGQTFTDSLDFVVTTAMPPATVDGFFSQPLGSSNVVMLAGQWLAAATVRIPETQTNTNCDPGMSFEAIALCTEHDFDTSHWQLVTVPAPWETYGPAWSNMNGEVVYRKHIVVLPDATGVDLALSIGAVDDQATVFFNSHKISDDHPATAPIDQTFEERYLIPADIVVARTNVLTIRIWDSGAQGGLLGPPTALYIRALSPAATNAYQVLAPESEQ